MRRDPAQTRALLVAAATAEFAALGIGGARVDRIAEVAGVNKERIYGVFGSKEALFDAVLDAAMDRHAAELGLPDDDPLAYAARVHDFYRDDPDLLRLLMWEALETRSTARHTAERYRAKVEALAAAQGRPADAAVATEVLVLIAAAMMPTMFPALTGAIVGPYLAEPDGRAGGDELRARLLEVLAPVVGRRAAGGAAAPAPDPAD